MSLSLFTLRGHEIISNDMGFDGEPFPWNEERRAILRSELDAHIAHLYRLNREEVRYILDPKDVFGADFPSDVFG